MKYSPLKWNYILWEKELFQCYWKKSFVLLSEFKTYKAIYSTLKQKNSEKLSSLKNSIYLSIYIFIKNGETFEISMFNYQKL